MKPEFLIVGLIVLGLFAATGCFTPRKKQHRFAPYIAQKESGAWHYRIDNATGVTHESVIGGDTPAACLMQYDRFRAWLSGGGEPIIRSRDGRERWHVELNGNETIDCAEQDFATPSAARANFRAVKAEILAHPSPRVRRDVKL